MLAWGVVNYNVPCCGRWSGSDCHSVATGGGIEDGTVVAVAVVVVAAAAAAVGDDDRYSLSHFHDVGNVVGDGKDGPHPGRPNKKVWVALNYVIEKMLVKKG